MAKVSQQLMKIPEDIASIINLSAKKKIRSMAAFRGILGDQAVDWRVSLSGLVDPTAGPKSEIQNVAIFTCGLPGEQPNIYVNREITNMPLSEITEWLMRQEDAFPDIIAHKLISDAVANGWDISTEYLDRAALSTASDPIPDMISIQADARNFDEPQWSRAEVSISSVDGEPTRNSYYYAPSENKASNPETKQITLAEIQDLLGNLAPTLPLLVPDSKEIN